MHADRGSSPGCHRPDDQVFAQLWIPTRPNEVAYLCEASVHWTSRAQFLTVSPPGPLHARQDARGIRHRTDRTTGKRTRESVYVVTDLPSRQAKPQDIALALRGHWHIENKIRYVRDALWDEGRSRIRTGHGPENMATLRNTTLNRQRATNMTEVVRDLSYEPGCVAWIGRSARSRRRRGHRSWKGNGQGDAGLEPSGAGQGGRAGGPGGPGVRDLWLAGQIEVSQFAEGYGPRVTVGCRPCRPHATVSPRFRSEGRPGRARPFHEDGCSTPYETPTLFPRRRRRSRSNVRVDQDVYSGIEQREAAAGMDVNE